MPYIKEADRVAMRMQLDSLVDKLTKAGEFNFAFTHLIHKYLQGNLSYSTINEMIGMLECCKLELYTKIARKYEDQKIAENGDMGILE